MTETQSNWPEDPTDGNFPPGLLLVLGATLVVQTVLLMWTLAVESGPAAPPSFVPSLVFVLSGVAAVAVIVDARSAPGWWHPRWGYWAVGVLLFGLNLGIGLGYYLRRQEAQTTSEPTARWKWPTVAAAVLGAVSTMVYRGLFDSPTGTAASVLAVLSLSVIGFGFAAALFDLRYVTDALEGTGVDWLMGGFHWPIMVILLIPANLLFVVLYLYRRKQLFGNAGRADPTPVAESATESGAETGGRDDPE